MYRKVVEPYDHDFPDFVDCAISGNFPKWLKGNLFRNGSGKFSFGDTQYKHLFDGMAVLHQYKCENGTVKYRNKLLESDAFARNTAANRIVISELGTLAYPDPCKSIFTRYFSYYFTFEMTDNACVNMLKMGDQLFAMTEAPRIKHINPDTLGTTGETNWSQLLSLHTATAHPLMDSDGTLYNLGTGNGKYVIIKVPPPTIGDDDPLKRAEIFFEIPAQMKTKPSYYHSFAMTDNFIIFIEQPVYLNVLKMLTLKFTGKTLVDCFEADNKQKTKFHIIDKANGVRIPVTYESDFMFFFHTANAYEENGCIVLDLSAYPDIEGFLQFTLENIKKSSFQSQTGQIWRYVLPIKPSEEKENQAKVDNCSATAILKGPSHFILSPEKYNTAMDLCRINENFLRKKYRYIYGLGVEDRIENSWLVKLDMDKKVTKEWKDERYLPNEPVFLPTPGAQEEDDGVILSPIISIDDSVRSALLVLDAATFTEIARAECPEDIVVPFTFHGIFSEN